MANTKRKVTIESINKAISKLQKQGIVPNTQNIANILGVTRQGVHYRFTRENKLAEFHELQNSKKNKALEMLKDIDTKDMTVLDIHRLVAKEFDGGFISYSTFLHVVEKNHIPHKETYLDNLSKIDTSQYTSKELHEMFGRHVSLYAFRQALYAIKAPYKKITPMGREADPERKELVKKIKAIDTSGMTIKEIWELPDMKIFRSHGAIFRFLTRYEIPYKRSRSSV